MSTASLRAPPLGKWGAAGLRNLDGRAFGRVTFREAIERSDNITFAKLSVEMGPTRFYRYIQNFGFGRRLGVDFPGEIAGTVLSPSRSATDAAVGKYRFWPGYRRHHPCSCSLPCVRWPMTAS